MAVERIDGVREAEFSFEDSAGLVTFDPTRTSSEAVMRELHRMTGFDAKVVHPAGDGEGPDT